MDLDVAELRLNRAAALGVALCGTALAIGNVKDGNIVQAMVQAQVAQSQAWTHAQTLQVDQHLAVVAAALAPSPDAAASFQAQARARAAEVAQAQAAVGVAQAAYNALNTRDDQFDVAQAALSIAVAVYGVEILARQPWLFAAATGFAIFGLGIEFAGFVGIDILHPDWLVRLLS